MQDTAGRIAGGDLTARVDPAGACPTTSSPSLARSIDAMADELETAQGHERAFLLSISHDLRTPLTSIKGYAEAMADGVIDVAAGPRPRRRRHLDRGPPSRATRRRPPRPRATRRARVLARHAAGRRPRRGRRDGRRVRTVGRRLGRSARARARRRRRTPTIDPERLAQIVANLVENALKYACDGRPSRRRGRRRPIEVARRRRRAGHPRTGARRASSSASTRPAARRAGKVGTGIGLAIVHELAGAMGGTRELRVASRGRHALRPSAIPSRAATPPPRLSLAVGASASTTHLGRRLDLATHHRERHDARLVGHGRDARDRADDRVVDDHLRAAAGNAGRRRRAGAGGGGSRDRGCRCGRRAPGRGSSPS